MTTTITAAEALKAARGLFANPEWLAATAASATLVLGLGLLAAGRALKRRDALVASSLAWRFGVSLGTFRRTLVLSLALVGTVGIGAALARPRWGLEVENARRQGTDVVILLDTSASMRAEDVSPSRFVLARQAVASLVEKLPEDRLALVACEGDAQTLVPLTLDSAAVALFLDALEPGVGTIPGTSLSAGIESALELLPPGAAPGRQVVLVSDGEDLEGGAAETATKARAAGVVLHTVFVGGAGAPVPEADVAGRVTGYKSGAGGTPVVSRPDPQLMRDLAARTGGSFTTVSPGRTDLDGLAREIGRAAQRPLAESLLTSRPERFQWPLAAGTVAVGLLLLLPAARRPRTRVHGAAAALAALVLALGTPGTASAAADAPQEPTTAGAGAATAATAPAVPAAPAAPAAPAGIAGRPPFASVTARSEAKKGAAALEEKKIDEALAHFQRQRELAPKDATGAFNACTALAAGHRNDEAIRACEEARLGKGPKALVRDAAYNEGTALLASGKYDDAARSFRQAIRLAPGDADAAFNYELALRRAEEEKKRQQQQQQKQDQEKKQDRKSPQPPPPSPQKQDPKQQEKERKEREDQEFQKKANMSREKADQLLQAIQNADRDEQRRRLAERRRERRPTRDW